jgi:hypothetical protein
MSPNNSSIKPRYYFHAEGHALSGSFDRPFQHVIEAQASASLPTIGGHADAQSEKFRAHHFASYNSARTHVSGSRQDESTFATQTITTIEGLNILNVLTADRVVGRLTSEHSTKSREGHILAIGSAFENLRISGHLVNVALRHDLFLECKTYEDLRKQVTKDAKSGKMSTAGDGAALCSLVEKIETDLPGATIQGHMLNVPHFGTVYFAEVLAEPATKTLTMLRLELGSPDSGTVTAGETRINGVTYP